MFLYLASGRNEPLCRDWRPFPVTDNCYMEIGNGQSVTCCIKSDKNASSGSKAVWFIDNLSHFSPKCVSQHDIFKQIELKDAVLLNIGDGISNDIQKRSRFSWKTYRWGLNDGTPAEEQLIVVKELLSLSGFTVVCCFNRPLNWISFSAEFQSQILWWESSWRSDNIVSRLSRF